MDFVTISRGGQSWISYGLITRSKYFNRCRQSNETCYYRCLIEKCLSYYDKVTMAELMVLITDLIDCLCKHRGCSWVAPSDNDHCIRNYDSIIFYLFNNKREFHFSLITTICLFSSFPIKTTTIRCFTCCISSRNRSIILMLLLHHSAMRFLLSVGLKFVANKSTRSS